MTAVPLVLVVGGDALAIRVCEELCATQGHRVALLWMHDHELAAKLDRLGCEYLPHPPNEYDALRIAGVTEAAAIMTLSDDDRLNLQVALKARDLNPSIRIVLRQFNRTLGRKLEQNLPNCSVLSLSAHSASTFAAAALDPACFYALQFPDLDGEQLGFAAQTARDLGVTGLTLQEAQRRLRGRIIGWNGSSSVPATPFAAEDRLVLCARLAQLAANGARPVQRVDDTGDRLRRSAAHALRRLRRLPAADPVLTRIALVMASIFTLAAVYFTLALHRDPLTAVYFVVTTATTTGYGDISPASLGWLPMIVANVVMISGVVASGLFIAFVSSAVTRAQFTAIQGLRQIRARGHVLVCGCGNVGTRVIETLRGLGQKIVVIELQPNPALIEASRRRHLELLTADATRDATLDLCNLSHARAVIAVTDSDTANLEVALGVHARNARVPVVMRVQDETFAESISRQFDGIRTYSTTVLAAPAFAMLSRFPGTRGRIAFGNDVYNVGERIQGEVPEPPPAEHCIPLGVWRGGSFFHIDAFEEMAPFDRLLFLVPLSQFKAAVAPGRETAAGTPAAF